MAPRVFEIDVPFGEGTAPVKLRLATWHEIGSIAEEPLGARASMLDLCAREAVLTHVVTINGKQVFGERKQALLNESGAMQAIRHWRDAIYDELRGTGRLYAGCPHCRKGEVELALLGLFNTVGQLPPYMVSPDHLYFLPPFLGLDWPRPARPEGPAYAAHLRVELPTAIAGIERSGPQGGFLRVLEPAVEAKNWKRWGTDGVNVPIGRGWWTQRNAAFRATVRLASTLKDCLPPSQVTPKVLEALPAVDIYFLDALYWYTHYVDVAPHTPPRTCPQCGGRFLPVAAVT